MEQLVSVITTVYNTEKYLPKCLESILNQSYRNIQLIVVDDGSPGNVAEVVNNYKSDQRVMLIGDGKNRGLFHARLLGAEQANGQYIMFVDSDDYIGVDYIRLLVEGAQANQADIVKARFVNDYISEKKILNYIYNQPNKDLYGHEIAYAYFSQIGLDFSYHTIWNKLYAKELWDKCIPYYAHITQHLIMTEDFAFSTPLMIFANHMVEIDCDTYFYVQRPDASTGIEKNYKKYAKNIKDLNTSFSFVEWFLKETDSYDVYSDYFEKWKSLYGRLWVDNINEAGFPLTDKYSLKKLLKEALSIEKLEPTKSEDNYSYSLQSQWNESIETAKQRIMDPEIKAVSFDMFDTLVQRPFFYPTDLFSFMNRSFKRRFSSIAVSFSELRVEAETIVRNLMSNKEADITIAQIYGQIADMICVDKMELSFLMEMEQEMEVRFCYTRRMGKELYRLAKYAGKKVLIISDMYLPSAVLKQILEKNGFANYDELFVSCECGKTKNHGSLYTLALKKYAISGSELLHIGDNYDSDIISAQKRGIHTFHLPKAVDVYCGKIEGYSLSNNGVMLAMERSAGYMFKNKIALQFLGVRSAIAVIANQYFDNPYRSFSKESDFNSDPYYMGLSALGMHMLGICLDLNKQYASKDKIMFVSRDGYLCKKVYDLLKPYINGAETEYLYLSRKAVLPIQFEEPVNYRLVKKYMDLNYIQSQTPKNILKSMFHISINQDIIDYFSKYQLDINSSFANISKLDLFLELCAKNQIIEEQIKTYISLARKHFENILNGNLVLFDLGYGGTSQMLLSNLMNKPIDAYYVYADKETPYLFAREYRYNVKTFYPYTPAISGPVREFFFSEAGPSCIGYKEEKGNTCCIFEDKISSYFEKNIASNIERGVLDFNCLYMQYMGVFLEELNFRAYDLSIPFEYLIHKCKKNDMLAFSSCMFEDDVSTGDDGISVYSIWKNEVKHYSCNETYSYFTELPELYMDGYFVKLYKFCNKIAPKGSSTRILLKKFCSFFLQSK